MNIYAPNNDDPDFFRSWIAEARRFTPDYKIIGGDFNLVLDVNYDQQGGSHTTHHRSQQILLSYMSEDGIIDIWREMHPDEYRFTWKVTRPHLIFERLDFFLISDSFSQFIAETEIYPSHYSDHAILTLIAKFSPNKKGPGYWKFNNALLRDRNYVDGLNNLLDIELAQDDYRSSKDKWENIKLAVRGSTLQYAARKKKSQDCKLAALEKKLKEIEKRQHKIPYSLMIQDEKAKSDINREIIEYYAEKTRGRY